MKVTIYARYDDYNGIQVASPERYKNIKADAIADLIADDYEFEIWLNNTYSPIDIWNTSREQIKADWARACAKDWENDEGEEWVKFEVEV